MADVNGENYAKSYVTKPIAFSKAAEVGGKLRLISDTYEASSAAAGTDVLMGRLQKGN